MIETLDEILALFPPEPRLFTSREIHCPCPFCKGSGKNETSFRGHLFRGEDRFIFRKDKPPYCRQCNRAYSYQTIVDLLWPGNQVSEDLEFTVISQNYGKPNPPTLTTVDYVWRVHKTVKREYWYKFGWSDEVIDRFMLGYGTFYAGSSKASRHLIPFVSRKKDEVMNGWSFEGRLEKDSRAKEERNIKTGGLTKGHFWYVQDDATSKTLAISEGPKDGISAWVLGYKNFVAVYSSTLWEESIGEFIQEQGYTKVIILGDNDEPGRKFSRQVALDFRDTEVAAYSLGWTLDIKEGGDLTNLLESKGIADAADYVQTFMISREHEVPRGFIKHYPDVDPKYVPADPKSAVTVDEIRAEMPKIVSDFLVDYKDLKDGTRGTIKILAAPPGTGKSYTLVREAEAFARRQLAIIEEAYQKEIAAAREVKIDNLYAPDAIEEHIRNVKRKSPMSVLWVSPFKNGWDDIVVQGYDPDLWYNYQARQAYDEKTEEGNCKYYGTVTALAEKGYASRNFCETVCPAREWCLKQGYLKQDEARKSKPITFARHASMDTSLAAEPYKLHIIDEDITSVFDREVRVKAEELRPVGSDWSNIDEYDDNYDPDVLDSNNAINDLVDGLRALLLYGGDLHGLKLTRELDTRMNGRLRAALAEIDMNVVKSQYQPDRVRVLTEKEARELPPRCLPDIIEFLQEEAYLDNVHNSRLHVANNQLIYLPLRKVHIPHNRPIIVADGTAEPDLYGILFDREVSVYKPEVRSPHAHTTVIYGSDFTRTTLKKEVGKTSEISKSYDSRRTVKDMSGAIVDPDEIPEDPYVDYESVSLAKIYAGIDYIMSDSRNEKLLVVTYKWFVKTIEPQLNKHYSDRIEISHYGSLRGTNKYKDFTTVLLLGCQRIPYYAIHRKAQAWAILAGHETYLRPELTIKAAPYHGTCLGYTHKAFYDDFANMFVDQAEIGEAQQCLDRIRLYSSEQYRHAYIMMSRPVAKWVTDIKKLDDITDPEENPQHLAARLHMKKFYLANRKFPSYNHVIDKYTLSTKTIKKIREELEREFRL